MFVKFASVRTVYQARSSTMPPTSASDAMPTWLLCREPQYDTPRKHHTRPPSTNEFACHRYYNPPFP
ncbi:hypothetical protein PISMIDRAFT_687809 [Pisolithus microcarpus 441]|uniref:Uncharacterized protein n=1 Tax=Pisolithus microcarpus 441 TaxID=765257 RepID=A0A0C9YD56_9AGAM|nr:hypothetical protein PISMIDRAFT_687809 [Pisolithus microcarpus 441]